jgi:hypothetical protein
VTLHASIAKKRWSRRRAPFERIGRQSSISTHLPPFKYREGQTADDFAVACWSCNSSRGAKPLEAFVEKRGIADTVAPVVKAYLSRAKGRTSSRRRHR